MYEKYNLLYQKNCKNIVLQGDVDEFGEIMLWTSKPKSAEVKIKGVLQLIRNDKFEVSFIATYRKEVIQVCTFFVFLFLTF